MRPGRRRLREVIGAPICRGRWTPVDGPAGSTSSPSPDQGTADRLSVRTLLEKVPRTVALAGDVRDMVGVLFVGWAWSGG